jgi:hypothetical protein
VKRREISMLLRPGLGGDSLVESTARSNIPSPSPPLAKPTRLQERKKNRRKNLFRLGTAARSSCSSFRWQARSSHTNTKIDSSQRFPRGTDPSSPKYRKHIIPLKHLAYTSAVSNKEISPHLVNQAAERQYIDECGPRRWSFEHRPWSNRCT